MTENGAKYHNKLLADYAKNSSGIIKAVIALSFLASMAYNSGYFFYIEIPISKIPISLSDFINSSFIWFPYVAIIVLLFVPTLAMGDRIEKLYCKVTNNGSSQKYIYLVFASFMILDICIYVAIGNSAVLFIFMAISMAWGIFFVYKMHFFAKLSNLYFAIYIFLPVLIILIFGLGVQHAYDDLSSPPNASLKSKYNIELNKYCLLRSFEKGLLLYNIKDGKIIFSDMNGSIIYSIDKKYNFNKLK